MPPGPGQATLIQFAPTHGHKAPQPIFNQREFLGIDPGLQTTGFGVVDVEGQRLAPMRWPSGTLAHHGPGGDLPGRLKTMFDGITEVAHSATSPMRRRWRSCSSTSTPSPPLRWASTRAALTALVNANLPVAGIHNLQMKKAVVGHGRAAKSQVQEMVRRLLTPPGLPGTDAGRCAGWPLPMPTPARPWRVGVIATRGASTPSYKGGRKLKPRHCHLRLAAWALSGERWRCLQ